MKTVFLDFDGVLHARTAGTLSVIDGMLTVVGDDLFSGLPSFREWLFSMDDVHVVVSSSWRRIYSESELRGILDIGERFLGVTGSEGANRLDEIQASPWISQSEDWCIFDDDETLFPEHTPNLILCDGTNGISSIEFSRAAEILFKRAPTEKHKPSI